MTLQPTLAGFLVFLRSPVVGFNTTVLPDSEPVIPAAYEWAIELVNQNINCVANYWYTQAVYNLGADVIVNFAPDQAGQTFFADLRSNWNVLKNVSGTIKWAGDEGTQTALVVPKAAEMFTISDLQNMKTPWGRNYLAIAQKYGPSVWGIS